MNKILLQYVKITIFFWLIERLRTHNNTFASYIYISRDRDRERGNERKIGKLKSKYTRDKNERLNKALFIKPRFLPY